MANLEAESPVDVLIAECAETLRQGKRADCFAVLEQHPEQAAELAAFIDNYESIEKRFAQLRAVSTGTPCNAAEIPTLGADDTAAELPKVGGSFGDYDLLSEVARGGMGVVYKARQSSLNRIVALKMVLAERRESTLEHDRFLIEARAVARLNHPHIVPIYEVGERKGQPYFTMEYFSGGSLREQLEKLRGDRRAIARMMVIVARAVEHAHRRGILHRDIKPTNVLLDERGEPHVTDFGLAKQLDEQSDLTQAGAIVGTPSYMAPEQAQGQTDLTTAVDVYGLGSMLYEMLTGRPPFKRSTPFETMMAVLSSQEPQRPRQLTAEIEPDLETICLKALEKDPLARYGSADALADDLERWLDGQPILARPVTTVERLVKWSRRQPLLAGSLATVCVAALALLTLAGFLWQNAEARAQAVKDLGTANTQLAQANTERKAAEAKKSEAELLADEQRKIADQQKALADKISVEVTQLQKAADQAQERLATADRTARRITYAADMQLAHVAWKEENVSLANELLEKYRSTAGKDDLRGFEWRFLWRQAHMAVREWMAKENPAESLLNGLAVSPDGKTIATATHESIKLWNLADGKLMRTIAVKDLACCGMAFTEGGSKLTVAMKKVSANMDQVMQQLVVGPAMKKEKFTLKTIAEQLEIREWNLNGDEPSAIVPFDAARLPTPLHLTFAGGVFAQHEGDAMFLNCIASSADGKMLALCGARVDVPGGNRSRPGEIQGGKLLIWDIEKGQVAATQNAPMLIYSVAFSQDGKKLAIGNSDGAVGLGEPDLARPPQLFLGHRGTVNTLQFSPDGKQLVSGASDGQAIVWDTSGGKVIRRLRGHVFPVTWLALVPNSEFLVSSSFDGSLKLWNLAGPTQPQIIRGRDSAIRSLVFSQEGKELYATDDRQGITKWNIVEGKRLGEQKTGAGTGFNPNLRFSPDGSMLVWTEGQRDTIRYRPSVGGTDQTIVWKGHVPYEPAISSDNKFLVARDMMVDGGMAVWSVEDGKLLATLDQSVKGVLGNPTFSPDGVHIAAGAKNGFLIWDWKAGTSKIILPQKESEYGRPIYSPDGRILAAAHYIETGASTNTVVEIIDVQTEQVIAHCQGAGRQLTALAFSPDGTRLATVGISASQQAMLKLWDTTTGRETFSASLSPCLITAIAFSLDGNRLAAAIQAIDITAAITGKLVPSEIYIWDATPMAAEPAAEQQNANDAQSIRGTWIVASAELNGQSSQSAAGDKFTFDGDKVTIENKVKKSEPIAYKLNPKKPLAEIDIEDKPVTLGIYELKGDTLTICYGQERPTKFDSSQGLLLRLERKTMKP